MGSGFLRVFVGSGHHLRRRTRRAASTTISPCSSRDTERPATPGAQENRRPVTPRAQQLEPEQAQPKQTHDQRNHAQEQSHHAHDRPHPKHDRFWRWYEGKEASEPGGQEQRDAPERPRELPRLWREGKRYFSQGVKEQFLRETRDCVRGQLS